VWLNTSGSVCWRSWSRIRRRVELSITHCSKELGEKGDVSEPPRLTVAEVGDSPGTDLEERLWAGVGAQASYYRSKRSRLSGRKGIERAQTERLTDTSSEHSIARRHAFAGDIAQHPDRLLQDLRGVSQEEEVAHTRLVIFGREKVDQDRNSAELDEGVGVLWRS
jgi:hypothetical protein